MLSFDCFRVINVKTFEPIDNYAKDGGPDVVSLLCSFHELLRSLIVKEVQ